MTGNEGLNPAYQLSEDIRDSVTTSDSGLAVNCDKINQDLAALANTPEEQREELIAATAYRLNLRDPENPNLPQIELLKSEESKLAVRVTDKEGHSKVCLPANETDASKYKPVQGHTVLIFNRDRPQVESPERKEFYQAK